MEPQARPLRSSRLALIGAALLCMQASGVQPANADDEAKDAPPSGDSSHSDHIYFAAGGDGSSSSEGISSEEEEEDFSDVSEDLSIFEYDSENDSDISIEEIIIEKKTTKFELNWRMKDVEWAKKPVDNGALFIISVEKRADWLLDAVRTASKALAQKRKVQLCIGCLKTPMEWTFLELSQKDVTSLKEEVDLWITKHNAYDVMTSYDIVDKALSLFKERKPTLLATLATTKWKNLLFVVHGHGTSGKGEITGDDRILKGEAVGKSIATLVQAAFDNHPEVRVRVDHTSCHAMASSEVDMRKLSVKLVPTRIEYLNTNPTKIVEGSFAWATFESFKNNVKPPESKSVRYVASGYLPPETMRNAKGETVTRGYHVDGEWKYFTPGKLDPKKFRVKVYLKSKVSKSEATPTVTWKSKEFRGEK